MAAMTRSGRYKLIETEQGQEVLYLESEIDEWRGYQLLDGLPDSEHPRGRIATAAELVTANTVPDPISGDVFEALNALLDSVIIFDKEWRYLYLNDAGWKIIGRKKEAVLGKKVWDVLPFLEGTLFQVSAYQAMREQERVEIEEYYPHRHEWFRTIFYPSTNILLVQIYNITELKNAEELNQNLMGSLDDAMQVYWSDANKQRREASNKKSRNNT